MMHEGKAKGSELIIFDDGTLYHIDLKCADNVPPNLFLVGAAERVDTIAKHFDAVTFRHRNKARPEFYIVSGMYKDVPMAAMSCGIGPDNIEIVINELHALFEYDHKADRWSDSPARLNFIRVGTSGSSLKEVPVGALAISSYALGLDNLGVFYPSMRHDPKAKAIEERFRATRLGKINPASYASAATARVAEMLERKARELGEMPPMIASGITTTSPGFFGPEGRTIGRIKPAFSLEEFIEVITDFESDGMRIVNHEMETSILFRLANEILGYNVGAICLVLDNLVSDQMMEAAHAAVRLERCITVALEAMVDLAKQNRAASRMN